MTTKTRVSMEEFLAMPETEPPSELIDGEIVQKAMPNEDHGEIVAELIALIRNYIRETREGRVVTEVRHAYSAEEWVYLPDINVSLGKRTTARGSTHPVEVAAEFAIEVLSPDDRARRVNRKNELYLRSGTQLLWLVDPDEEAITVYRPGEQATVHRAPETIDARPVLRDFHLDIAALFAVLYDDDE